MANLAVTSQVNFQPISNQVDLQGVSSQADLQAKSFLIYILMWMKCSFNRTNMVRFCLAILIGSASILPTAKMKKR